jgi:hypothetical protein
MSRELTRLEVDMAEATKAPTRRDLEDAVVKMSLTDEPFRNQLRANPRVAVEQVLAQLEPNAHLPKDLEVRPIYEQPNTFSIVIPRKAATDLSDAQLEQVAGGLVGGIFVDIH